MDSYQDKSILNYDYQEEALPFVVYNSEAGKYELTNESVEFLKTVPAPLGLVSVAGLYRTGKSYLLNRMLLNRSNGFGVGPSINPCTKGLWIWSKPIPGFTPEGDPINVLIVDTEGLGALDEDSNHDVRIFSLAVLLSSSFIYNSVGSIDESALSNLSLVVNLTKHIHIKSRGGTEDVDTEEYGTYFPSFMWVVRDFALQLVDQEGEAITSKDYFEKALETQKGFSDNVEAKNRIRRLLKSFFKDRDCCTMIRPLTNEENLQNLANMELSDLRADFVEQILLLRRKVLNKVKPKVLNGRKLTGSMMATMAQSYVVAINNGAVPNIENAWNYICKNECNKAIDESLQKFDEILKENAFQRIPMDEDEIKELYNEAKKEALIIFHKKAVGTVSEEYIKELKLKMQQIFQQLREENERESAQQSQIFLANSYQFIERKLKNKEFQGGFCEYEQDIKAFQNYFMENGPQGPQKVIIMLEFVQRAVTEAAEYFNKTILNELELQKSISTEHYKSLEIHIKDLKQDYARDKEKFESKLRCVEVEKAELSAIEQSLRENLDRLQIEKKNCEAELMQKMEVERKERIREVEDLKNKAMNNENMSAEMQRKVFAAQCEFEKDKALLDQKIEFLDRTIQDYQKKETEYSLEMKTQKKEHQTSVREMQSKYEQQIKSLNIRFEETTEKYLTIQSQFEEIEQKYNYERQQWQDSQESLKNNANISQSHYSDMQKQMEDIKQKSRQEIDKLGFELDDIKEQSRYREEDLETSLRDKDEELKNIKTKFEKELAIFQQKVEFKEVQMQQLKTQLDDSRKTHDAMNRAMESRSKDSHDGREIAQKQVEELKEFHEEEVRKLEKEYEDARKRLESQNEHLSMRNSELELDFKLMKQELEKECEQLKSQMEVSEILRDKAVSQSKNSDHSKLRMLEETEERHKSQIYALEKELEEAQFRAETDLKEVQTKSEEALAQLKSFYEIDKKRLENRLAEEKERDQKKLLAQQEEFESRLRYEQQQHEEDVEMLQEELREKEHRYQSQQTQLEHEILLAQQKIETLDFQMREKEERYNKDQSMNASQLDQQFERFNVERRELINKNESFNGTVSQKDREITLLKTKLDSYLEDMDKKKKSQDELKTELNVEKQKLNEKIDSLRAKNQEISDGFIQKKLEDAREIALYKQKQEFQEKKIEDLQKQCDEQSQKYEERIQNSKNEFQQEIQEMYVKMNANKEQMELKYEQKRRLFKEQESAYVKQLTEFQKEKAVLEEKAYHLEQKKEEVRIKLEAEITYLRDQLGNSSESLTKEREILLHDNERLKNSLQEMEREFSEVQSCYERDKALWDGKFQFLEQQKELAKSDLQEATRKFEMTLEQLQRRGSAEKDKFEISQNSLLGSIEQKYKSQIKDQIENNQKMLNDLNEKNKYLEKENRQLQNRLQLEQRDKMSDHGAMEKKVSELQDNDSRLQREIDELKSERDRRVLEGQRNVEKERENYKLKLGDTEQKCKELENRRSTMVFEVEKERAKWGLERDHLVAQKQEVQEQLERIQRRHEIMVRENEKLKSDRTNRKMMYSAGGVGSSTMLGSNQNAGGVQGTYNTKLNPSMFGQTLMNKFNSKENGVGSSQAFPNGFSSYISDGLGQSNKVDPHQLPLAMKEQNQVKIGGGSVTPNGLTYLKPSTQRDSSTNGLGSMGGNKYLGGCGGSSSTDESASNQ